MIYKNYFKKHKYQTAGNITVTGDVNGTILPVDENEVPQVTLPEFEVSASSPKWLEYQREGEKNYDKVYGKSNPYIERFMPNRQQSLNQQKQNYAREYAANKLLDFKPNIYGTNQQGRLSYYNSFTPKEKEFLTDNPKFYPAQRAFNVQQSEDAKKYGIIETFRDPNKLAQASQGTGERFRLFPNAQNDYESYINPVKILGDMASSLGQAPLNFKQGNYLSGVLGIGAPIIGGALTGALSPKANVLKDNLLPLSGAGLDLAKKGLQTTKRVFENLKESPYVEALNPMVKRQYKLKRNKIQDDLNDNDTQTHNAYLQQRQLGWKKGDINHDYLQRVKDEQHILQNSAYFRLRPSIPSISHGSSYRYWKESDIRYAKLSPDKQKIFLPKPLIVESFFENQTLKKKVGENEFIIDFATGQKVPVKIKTHFGNEKPLIEFSINPKNKQLEKRHTDEIYIESPEINQEYIETLNKNMEYVAQQFPNSKPYGSSVTVSKVGLPHATDDIDIIMTSADYEKIRDRFPVSHHIRYGSAHIINPNYGDAGKIDVNVILQGPDGKAEGELARELYRQFFPEEFYAENQRLLKAGLPPSDFKVSKTPEELMQSFDPEVKSIIDAYEAGADGGIKSKHINRIDALINYGDVEKVKKGQLQYAKSIMGNKADVGKQFSIEQLSDVDKNKKVLKEIEFIGDIEHVAKNPERMQLALNDFYINNSIYTRRVKRRDLDYDQIVDSYMTWKNIGGAGHGDGLNTAKLGESGKVYGDVVGNKQFKLSYENTDDIESYISTVKRQTSGNYEFTSEERKIIEEVAKKYNINLDGQTYSRSTDLLFLNNQRDIVENKQLFLKEVGERLNLKTVSTNIEVGNSTYATDLGVFDKDIDQLRMSLDGITPSLKSFDQRRQNFNISHSNQTQSDINIAKGEFYRIRNILASDIEKIKKERIKNQTGTDVLVRLRDKALEKLAEKKAGKKATLEEIEKINQEVKLLDEKIKDLEFQRSELSDLDRELYQRQQQIKDIQSNYQLILGTTTVMGSLGAFLYNADKNNKIAGNQIMNQEDIEFGFSNLDKQWKEDFLNDKLTDYHAKNRNKGEVLKNFEIQGDLRNYVGLPRRIIGQIFLNKYDMSPDDYQKYIDKIKKQYNFVEYTPAGIGYKYGGQAPMVKGTADIITKIKNFENRKSVANSMLRKFKKEKLNIDKNNFLKLSNVKYALGGEMSLDELAAKMKNYNNSGQKNKVSFVSIQDGFTNQKKDLSDWWFKDIKKEEENNNTQNKLIANRLKINGVPNIGNLSALASNINNLKYNTEVLHRLKTLDLSSTGTDVATKTNNPGNMKFHPWMSKYGAVPSGIKGTDGGVFAAFPTIGDGLAAYEMQLFGHVDGVFKSAYYKENTTVDEALRIWSNNGYGGEIYPEIANKKLSEVTDEERKKLAALQFKQESKASYKKLIELGLFSN